MSADALQLRVAQTFTSVLKVSTLDPNDDFFSVGGNLVIADSLIQKLQPLTSKKLTANTLVQAPSITRMTRLIRENFRPVCGNTLACIQPGTGGSPIVFCHAVGGTVLFYHEIAMHLRTRRPIYALQAHGVAPGDQPLLAIEEMAATYRLALQAQFGNDEYQIGGYSFGCLIALEMARQSEAEGCSVAELILMGPPAIPLEPAGQVSEQAAQDQAVNLLKAFTEREDVEVEPAVGHQLIELYKANLMAEAAYRPTKVAADFLLVVAEMDADQEAIIQIWQSLTSGAVRPFLAPGHHTSMIRLPQVAQWAGDLLLDA